MQWDVYLKLLASLLPTSTRQPDPVAVLFGQTLKLSFIFSPISHSQCLATASPEFSSAYFTTESLNFKSYFLFSFAAPESWRSSMWYWLTESEHNMWKRWRKTCSVSGHVFFLDLKKKWIRLSIYLEPAVIYQNIHLHRASTWSFTVVSKARRKRKKYIKKINKNKIKHGRPSAH